MTNYNTTYLRDSTKKSFAERDTHVFSDKRLNAFVYENAYVLPYKETKDPCHIYAGVVSEKNEYLEQSAFHENIGMGYSFSKKGVVTIDVPVIYLGVIENCWGHVITDALKKIWYIRTVEGNKLLQNGGGNLCYSI